MISYNGMVNTLILIGFIKQPKGKKKKGEIKCYEKSILGDCMISYNGMVNTLILIGFIKQPKGKK